MHVCVRACACMRVREREGDQRAGTPGFQSSLLCPAVCEFGLIKLHLETPGEGEDASALMHLLACLAQCGHGWECLDRASAAVPCLRVPAPPSVFLPRGRGLCHEGEDRHTAASVTNTHVGLVCEPVFGLVYDVRPTCAGSV